MNSSKKAVIIALILGVGIFGYSQYASASQIGVVITQSDLVEEKSGASIYNVELEFDNPSLLMLSAGETDFILSAKDSKIGDGTLEPFILPAISKTSVKGIFHVNDLTIDEQISEVKISGVTKYDVLFTSIDIPFVYYPTEEQAREFIHQN